MPLIGVSVLVLYSQAGSSLYVGFRTAEAVSAALSRGPPFVGMSIERIDLSAASPPPGDDSGRRGGERGESAGKGGEEARPHRVCSTGEGWKGGWGRG